MPDLFSSQAQHIPLNDGELTLYQDWLSVSEQEAYFRYFEQAIAWQQSTIQVYGKSVAIPRLNAWYGDPGCHYGYSGHQLPLHDWLPQLQDIRTRLQEELGEPFNSVLANLYRDGTDRVAWHADNEPELGINPVIASISLGAERRFCMKHRSQSQPTLNLNLTSGSLLLMSGSTQHHWLHSLPKTSHNAGPRINLTFRNIIELS